MEARVAQQSSVDYKCPSASWALATGRLKQALAEFLEYKLAQLPTQTPTVVAISVDLAPAHFGRPVSSDGVAPAAAAEVGCRKVPPGLALPNHYLLGKRAGVVPEPLSIPLPAILLQASQLANATAAPAELPQPTSATQMTPTVIPAPHEANEAAPRNLVWPPTPVPPRSVSVGLMSASDGQGPVAAAAAAAAATATAVPSVALPAGASPAKEPKRKQGIEKVGSVTQQLAGVASECGDTQHLAGKLKKDGCRVQRWCCSFVFTISARKIKEFQLVPRLIGRGGENMRRISLACNGKLRIRGQGSGFIEGKDRKEAKIPLQLFLSCESPEAYVVGHDLIKETLDALMVRFTQFCQKKNEEVQTCFYVVREGTQSSNQLPQTRAK